MSTYDPTIHDNQIVAGYETETQAHAALETLKAAGFSAGSMHVVARGADSVTSTAASDYDHTSSEGFWGAIKSMFVPDEDRSTYGAAVARGHAMLVVTPDGTMDRQHLIHVLESTDPLDFDTKLEEWRQTGYDTGGALTMGALDASAGSMHASSTSASTSAGSTMGAAGTGYVAGAAPVAPMPSTGFAPAAGTDGTIKVLEENLHVGKREVAAGAVRVRSYIVERPVQETVSLREERVSVERTPVDRPASSADFGAFQERTIEARATSEEAVVAKDARVVEEISLNKQASERVETVHDTVRKTEVEIEGADSAGLHGTLPGKVGVNPNATPGATTSGANAPLK